MKTLENLLVQLGFDKLQGILYSELYFHGASTVLELSRKTNIKRPTVHFHIDQLIEKGIVSERTDSGHRLLMAEDPTKFVSLVEQKKQKAIETESSLSRVLSEVATLNGTSATSGISVVIEDGIESLRKIYSEALEYGEAYSYFDFEKGKDLEKMRRMLFNNVVIRKNITSFSELYYTREIKVPDFIKDMRNYDQFAFAKTSMRLYGNAANVLVYGQNIVMISYDKDWKIMRVVQPILAMFIREMVITQIY